MHFNANITLSQHLNLTEKGYNLLLKEVLRYKVRHFFHFLLKLALFHFIEERLEEIIMIVKG